MLEIIIYFLVIGALMASIRAGAESQGLTSKNYLTPNNTKVINKRIKKIIINTKKTIKQLDEQAKKTEKPIIEIPAQEINELNETIDEELKTIDETTKKTPTPIATTRINTPTTIIEQVSNLAQKINPTQDTMQNQPTAQELNNINDQIKKADEALKEAITGQFDDWKKQQEKEKLIEQQEELIEQKINTIKKIIKQSFTPNQKEQLKLLNNCKKTIEELTKLEKQLNEYAKKDLEEKQKIINKMKQLCNQLDDGYKKQWLNYLDNLEPGLNIKQLEQINKKLERIQKENKLKNKIKTQDDYLQEYSNLLGTDINNQTRDELLLIKNRLQTLNNSINIDLTKYPIINNTVNKANKKIKEINNKLSSMPGVKTITPQEETKIKDDFRKLSEKIKLHGTDELNKRSKNDLITLTNLINELTRMSSSFTLMGDELKFIQELEIKKQQAEKIIETRNNYESAIITFINTEWEKIRLGNEIKIEPDDIRFDYNSHNFGSGSIGRPIRTKYNFTIPFSRDIQSIKDDIIRHLKTLFTTKMNYLTEKTEKIIRDDKRDWATVFNEIKNKMKQ